MKRASRQVWLGGLLLAAATVGVFHAVPWFEFLSWDDDLHITRNPWLRTISWSAVGRFWTQSYENLYIPVSYTVFAGLAWVSQFVAEGGPTNRFHPAVFHGAGLLLHGLCAGWVYRLAWQQYGHVPAALAGGLLFALHPLQVESVSWIGETRGLLSAAFSLLAIDAYLGFARGDLPRWDRYAAATVCYALALLSKPTAVCVPLVAAVLHAGWVGGGYRRWAVALVPWLVLAGALVLLTKNLQADARLAYVPAWWERPLIAGDALAFYLVKLVAPVGLAFDYGRAPAVVSQQGWFYAAWLLPVGLTAALAATRRRRLWLTAWGVFVAVLLPVLGFVPFLYQDISTVADRYVYLAMLGPAIALAGWLAEHWTMMRMAVWAAILGALAQLSYTQSLTWRSDATLNRRGLEVNPRSHVAHYNLGNVALADDSLGEAVFHFERTLALVPDYVPALSRLAFCLAEEGKWDESLATYDRALALNPRFEEAHGGRAVVLARQGRFDEALAAYQRALEIDSGYVAAGVRLAEELASRGRTDDARRLYEQAIATWPEFAEAHFKYAELLAAAGDTELAIEHYRQAVRYHPRLAEAHNNLAGLLLQQGEPVEAEGHLRRALAEVPRYFEAQFNLGVALAQQERIDEARTELYRALALVSAESHQARQVRQLIRQLSLMESVSP